LPDVLSTMSPRPPQPEHARIAVIGLGYVGLPLAVAFGERQPTLGYDIDERRIERLRSGDDPAREVSAEQLGAANQLEFSARSDSLADRDVYIVAVPTPVDKHKRPDLTHLEDACHAIGPHLRPGNVVIFEATVFPGCTREVCVPLLEAGSGLSCDWQIANAQSQGSGAGDEASESFSIGYSPERINPGDSAHSLRNVVKITAGSTPETAEFVDALYKSVVDAGTHPVSTIEVAEAAKVIENTQRDLNIALVNELALIFNKLDLDTTEVLEAAGTKWNFLPFRPGLVGGHCIGVDPYYLTYKAEAVGYHPQVILAGRRINDGMGRHVAGELVKLMIRRGIAMKGARVLVMGLTFKENCADIRNTRTVDIIEELQSYGLTVDAHDPWVSAGAAREELGIGLVETPQAGAYDGIVLAVGHRLFAEQDIERIRSLGRENAVVYDVKSLFSENLVDARL
jgi:UDP-N-acetyl-D-galactosamine dehydrogenase